MKKCILIILLYLIQIFSQESIYQIHFSGLEKTRPGYLRKFIHSRKGSHFDSLIVKEDVQRLLNLQLFYEVIDDVRDNDQGRIINFK